MYRILDRQDLAPAVHMFKIEAPEVAKKAQPGQFLILRIDEQGERIPLTFADWDAKEGSVTVIFMEAGATTAKLGQLKQGDSILNFVGPLGLPTHIEKYGTVVCVAGGIGVAPIAPIAAKLKQAGNKVISIMGARNKGLMFWEDRLRAASERLIVTTDDGSAGRKALVTEPLKEILASDEKVNLVIAIGPMVMMKFCSLTTQPFGVKTVVSLNPIMVDGTGMCGCCRVSVDNATRFACVDGPDFDAHKVDWDVIMARSRTYSDEEKQAMEKYKCGCEAKIAAQSGVKGA